MLNGLRISKTLITLQTEEQMKALHTDEKMEIITGEYIFPYEIDEQLENDVLILPYSTDAEIKESEDIVYLQSSISVLKKLTQNGVKVSFAVGEMESCSYIENRSVEWFGPTLFFSLAAISQNPNIVSICLSVLSSYIYDIFKGKNENPNIRCSFVIEDKKKKKKIDYKGPVSGMKDVEKIINGKK
jgi:hypothetical protein